MKEKQASQPREEHRGRSTQIIIALLGLFIATPFLPHGCEHYKAIQQLERWEGTWQDTISGRTIELKNTWFGLRVRSLTNLEMQCKVLEFRKEGEEFRLQYEVPISNYRVFNFLKPPKDGKIEYFWRNSADVTGTNVLIRKHKEE